MPGALIGGLLAYQIYSEAWAIGAVVGALAGLVVSRILAKPPGDGRLVDVETRLAEARDRLDWLDRRIAALEQSDRQAPSGATATVAPVAAPPPEPTPVEMPIARSEPVP